jgi:lipid-A-disaccharide synthase
VKLFFATGEASGELVAAELLDAIRSRIGVDAEGIGDARLERAGVRLVARTRGWASMGPIDALRRIPRLWTVMMRTALRLRRDPPDAVVLVDFGAFNLRLARTLRGLGFVQPIVYYAPPAAWLDNAKKARSVAARCDALTLFRHQAEFYRSLRLPIGYVGHPLVSTIAPRPPRPAPPGDSGDLALLPGSRAGEIERHAPLLLDAFARVRERRPAIRGTLVAADDDARRHLEHLLAMRSPLPIAIAQDARATLREADAAAIASGTAVLESALVGTPAVALYILSETQAKIARRVYHGQYITLPNLVLDEPLVPELIQEAATPVALADELLALLDDPARQLDGYARMRTALGPPDALQRNADWVLSVIAESNAAVAHELERRSAPGSAPPPPTARGPQEDSALTISPDQDSPRAR